MPAFLAEQAREETTMAFWRRLRPAGDTGASHPLAAGRSRSLKRKLSAVTTVAALCTVGLAALLMAHSYGDFAAARQNLYDISEYRVLLDAANVLSAERGPANSVLGEAPAEKSAARDRLREFRARSDAALTRLLMPPAAPAGLHQHHLPSLMVERVRERLRRVRTEVDALASRQREDRQMDELQHAIEGMFEAVDALQPLIGWQVRQLSACHPGLAAPALTGKMLGDLREYGGRAASQIMAPVAAREPIPIRSLADTSRSRGRLLELWELAGPAYNMYGDTPQLEQAYADASHQFFGHGLSMVDSMVAQGRLSGHYSMTPTEFTNRYVPTLEPLERLRRAFLDEVIAHFEADRTSALRVLAIAGSATALILLVLGYLLVFAQRSVFLPLLHARDAVIALAEGRSRPGFPMPMAGREMRRLFDALDILRRKLRERASLTEQLEHLARTDSLTGLLNRRALEHVAVQPADPAGPETVSLILMDVDRFKQINDRHGHPAGDEVLRALADLMRDRVDPAFALARFGGEEFAVLVPGAGTEDAASMAQALRTAICAEPVRLADGTRLPVTASFGVATGRSGAIHWPQLFAAADAALYRAKSDGRNCVRRADEPTEAVDD
jgi:diguanylate cyclase (GGDEF)-like protein